MRVKAGKSRSDDKVLIFVGWSQICAAYDSFLYIFVFIFNKSGIKENFNDNQIIQYTSYNIKKY